MSFWDVFWLLVFSFFFIAYLMVLFNIVVDLFRDPDVSGGMKAVWMICLIFVPALTAIVYLIVRGNGMAARQTASMRRSQEATDSYIRDVAGSSPTADIARAHELLKSGAITQAEFDALKAKALG